MCYAVGAHTRGTQATQILAEASTVEASSLHYGSGKWDQIYLGDFRFVGKHPREPLGKC